MVVDFLITSPDIVYLLDQCVGDEKTQSLVVEKALLCKGYSIDHLAFLTVHMQQYLYFIKQHPQLIKLMM